MNKKLILAFILIVLGSIYVLGQSPDITTKPEPTAEKVFEFPKFEKFILDNGLKIFIIEDHEQPTFALRLLIAGGKSIDTLKPGTADLTSALLTKGADKLKASDIAAQLDGIGASVTSEVSTDYITIDASGLMKHLPKVLDIYSKIILKPTFPEGEFEKYLPQFLASLQQEKGDPRTLANKMGRKVVYGEKHPYALDPDEKSVKSIEIEDIKNYYKTYFVPDNATLAIIGDIDVQKFSREIKKIFKDWKKASKPVKISLPNPQPMPMGVYFVERPGSVQSTIMITARAMPYGGTDYDKLSLATAVISGGISGRLFRTLREQYSYTYSPFGYLSQGKQPGRFVCGADVKNQVTDSAITVTLQQIEDLATVPPDKNELLLVGNYLAGTYKMSFENSGFLATAIQNADFYEISTEYIKNFAPRILSLTSFDVRDAAKKYLNSKKLFIVVVGSKEVKDKLAQFGKVYDYNLDFEPLSGENAKMDKVSIEPGELIEKYIKAIGGKEAIENVKTLSDTAKTFMTMNNNTTEGTIIQIQMAPDKKHFLFDMGVFKQEGWIDGSNVWIKVDEIKKIQNKEAEKYTYDAQMFKDTRLIANGYQCNVLGKQNGKILMKAVSPRGYEATYYFDEKTFLISKIERLEEMATGKIPITETIVDYIDIDGVKLPKTIETENPLYKIRTINNYVINPVVDEKIFKPEGVE